MVYSEYVKQRIVILHQTEGLTSPMIAKALHAEGITVSRVGVHKLLKRYEQTGRTSRRAGSGRLTKATESVKIIVKEQMRQNDETMVKELQKLLADHGHRLSGQTVLHCWTSLGWTHRRSTYCQLI